MGKTLIALTLGLLLSHDAALGRPPPGSDPTSARAMWFVKQRNKVGGSCCALGDGHELTPGDVRYDPASGEWEVRLPPPSVSTFGTTLDGTYSSPKQWVVVHDDQMRDPAGGPPPVTNPLVWYDTRGSGENATFVIFCLEPNPMF